MQCSTVKSSFGEKNFTTVYWHKSPPSMKLMNPDDIQYPKNTCYSVINGTNEQLVQRPESKIAVYDQAAQSMRFYHFQDGFCRTPKSPTAFEDQYNTSVVQCDVCTRLSTPTAMSSMVTGCADTTFRILTYTSGDCSAGTETTEQYKFYDGKDESARGLQRAVTIPDFKWPVNFCYTWTNNMNGHQHAKSTYIKETNTMRQDYFKDAGCTLFEWSELAACDVCNDGFDYSYKVSECTEATDRYTVSPDVTCSSFSQLTDAYVKTHRCILLLLMISRRFFVCFFRPFGTNSPRHLSSLL